MDKKIGEGRTAEIYALDDQRIAKVFRSYIPKHFIDYELKMSRLVESLGLPVPKVYGIEELGGESAIIYEKIEGVTLLAMLVQNPSMVEEYAQKIAEIHYKINSKSGGGLDSFKEHLMRNINEVIELTGDEKAKIIEYLKKLPDQSQLCHGDFHPENVFLTPKGPVVIDWTTACSGHALTDVARTGIILQYAALPEGIPVPMVELFQMIRPKLYDNYFHTYTELSGYTYEEIIQWELPVMAARLVEFVPDQEKDVLLSKIRERLA